MRLSTIFWGFILILIIVFIAYELVNETFVKSVQAIKTIQEFRQLEP